MPTYGYRCVDCGYQFETFQRFSEDPLRECPSCQGVVRRVIHPVGVVFKGTGWYITDSRSSSSSERSGARSESKDTKSSGSDTAKSSDGTTESTKGEPAKPAAAASGAADSAAD